MLADKPLTANTSAFFRPRYSIYETCLPQALAQKALRLGSQAFTFSYQHSF